MLYPYAILISPLDSLFDQYRFCCASYYKEHIQNTFYWLLLYLRQIRQPAEAESYTGM